MLKNKDGSYSRKENDVLWLENVLDNYDRNNSAPFLWDCNNYFHKTGKLGFTDSDIAEICNCKNNMTDSKYSRWKSCKIILHT